MLHAEKSNMFSTVFEWYQRYYLWPRNFHSVHYSGDIDPHSTDPVLYIANHCSWWDGLLIFQLVQQFSSKSHYMMMEEKQLRKYRFFRKMGAFSVDKSSLSEIRKSVRYARALMSSGKAVWLFPQGAIFHQEQRPLLFENGAAFLLKSFEKAVVKPVTLHYSFNQYQRPTASVVFGEEQIIRSTDYSKQELTDKLQGLLEGQLELHRAEVIKNIDFHQSEKFTPVLKKGKSTTDFMDTIKNGLET